jgi:hypothetical protein
LSRDRSLFGSSWNRLAFGLEVNTSSEILFLVLLFLKINTALVVLTMQEVPFEISLRKTTLRDLDGTVHHIPCGDKKSIKSFQRFFRINLDVGVGYSSNLEHVITVINKVGNEIANDLYGDNIILAPQFLRVNDFAASIMLKNIRRNITK